MTHDRDLKKVANASTRISDATYDELRQVDVGVHFDPMFEGETMPTLDAVLAACRGRARVNIELKYYGRNDLLEQRVVRLVEANEMSDRVVVMSLDADGVGRMRLLRPEWTYGLLTAVAAGDLTKADVDFLAVSHTLATRAFISRAHERGKRVHVWTVNDPALMSVMIGRGADNLITDEPALARQVLRERTEMGYLERALIDLAYRFGLDPLRQTRKSFDVGG